MSKKRNFDAVGDSKRSTAAYSDRLFENEMSQSELARLRWVYIRECTNLPDALFSGITDFLRMAMPEYSFRTQIAIGYHTRVLITEDLQRVYFFPANPRSTRDQVRVKMIEPENDWRVSDIPEGSYNSFIRNYLYSSEGLLVPRLLIGTWVLTAWINDNTGNLYVGTASAGEHTGLVQQEVRSSPDFAFKWKPPFTCYGFGMSHWGITSIGPGNSIDFYVFDKKTGDLNLRSPRTTLESDVPRHPSGYSSSIQSIKPTASNFSNVALLVKRETGSSVSFWTKQRQNTFVMALVRYIDAREIQVFDGCYHVECYGVEKGEELRPLTSNSVHVFNSVRIFDSDGTLKKIIWLVNVSGECGSIFQGRLLIRNSGGEMWDVYG